MIREKLRELAAQFQLVLSGRGGLIDSLLPPIVFLLVNALFGLGAAGWVALTLALGFTLLRALRGQPVGYALGGVGGVALALLLVRLSGRAEGYFLPGIIIGGLTVLLCVGSLIAGRPMVAWTSHLTRGWPWGWYWHPQVRPAYAEVTVAWTLFFAGRWLVQLNLFRAAEVDQLAWVNALTGWPATLILLAGSYLYGQWRLQTLEGPSVEEFKADAPPPWEGQQRGF
jgi:hypothetical protein